MKIDIKNDKVVYITIGENTYYIDDTTGEQYVTRWNTDNPESNPHYHAEWKVVKQ